MIELSGPQQCLIQAGGRPSAGGKVSPEMACSNW